MGNREVSIDLLKICARHFAVPTGSMERSFLVSESGPGALPDLRETICFSTPSNVTVNGISGDWGGWGVVRSQSALNCEWKNLFSISAHSVGSTEVLSVAVCSSNTGFELD